MISIAPVGEPAGTDAAGAGTVFLETSSSASGVTWMHQQGGLRQSALTGYSIARLPGAVLPFHRGVLDGDRSVSLDGLETRFSPHSEQGGHIRKPSRRHGSVDGVMQRPRTDRRPDQWLEFGGWVTPFFDHSSKKSSTGSSRRSSNSSRAQDLRFCAALWPYYDEESPYRIAKLFKRIKNRGLALGLRRHRLGGSVLPCATSRCEASARMNGPTSSPWQHSGARARAARQDLVAA